jgi:hypothetical protein
MEFLGAHDFPKDCDARTTPGPFDGGCAAKALHDVSAPARACGNLPDDVHLEITFAPTGLVAAAEVDAPAQLDPSLASCIEDRFRGASIPPFLGATVKVGKSLLREAGEHVDPRPGYPADCDTRTTIGPFDRGCAAKTLVEVSQAARACGELPDGVHVKITFASTGRVEAAVVDQPAQIDRALASCIEERFRQAHIPPFLGGPVPVGKSLAR